MVTTLRSLGSNIFIWSSSVVLQIIEKPAQDKPTVAPLVPTLLHKCARLYLLVVSILHVDAIAYEIHKNIASTLDSVNHD